MLTQAAGLDQVVHPMHKALALVESLAQTGRDPQPALAGTGLRLCDLSNAAARMSARQLLAICRNVMHLTDDSLFALRAGRRVHATHLGFFGFVLLCSATPREAMECMNRYRPLSTPVIGVEFREEAERCMLRYFDSHHLPDELFRFVLDFQMGIAKSLLEDQMDPSFSIDLVRVSYPEGRDTGARENLLEAPIEFGCAQNELVWDRRWMDQPQPYANSLTATVVRETCERMLASVMADSGTAGVVMRILAERPGGRFPGLEEIAAHLHVTSRTLRRKLQAEGTSYASMLASVRKTLAIEYLRTTRMKTAEIAENLGFSVVANFRHAFRKWTDRSPSDYRGRTRAGRVPAGEAG